jgi:phosphatidyl-myo-inositol dimannoside synthase
MTAAHAAYAWGVIGMAVAIIFFLKRLKPNTPKIARLTISRHAAAEEEALPAMARILLISSTFPPVVGGSAVVYENLCRNADGAIVGLGATHDHATGRPFSGIEAYDLQAGYPIHRLRLLRPAMEPDGRKPGRARSRLRDLALMGRVLVDVAAIARRERVDVVCLGDLVYGGWLVFPLRYLFGYKVLIYVHGEEVTTRQGGGLLDTWRAKFLAHAHAVIAVSSFTRDAMVRLMKTDPAKIKLIPNGVDLERFQVRRPRSDTADRYGVRGRRVILSVGRLVPRKGVDHLIAAMPAILKACPDAHLLIAGEGPLRPALEQSILALDLERHVSLLGAVQDEALCELYALADLFALPNRTLPDGDTEGFGLVFLEANASGKPVVAGRAGGAADAVTDGVNGLTVDGTDVAAIAEVVIRLLNDPELRGRLAAQGLALARTSDWRSRTAMFLSLCKRLCA